MVDVHQSRRAPTPVYFSKYSFQRISLCLKQMSFCSPVRTAIGTYGGTLKDMPATDIGAVAIRATLERAKNTGDDIDTVVMGNVI